MRRRRIKIEVDELYYKKLNNAKLKFMKERGLFKLANGAFTGILADNNILKPTAKNIKNVNLRGFSSKGYTFMKNDKRKKSGCY